MSMNDRVIDLVQEGIDAALRVGDAERFEPDRAARRQLARRDLRFAGIHRARRRAADAGGSEARALHRDVQARHQPDPRVDVSQGRRRAHRRCRAPHCRSAIRESAVTAAISGAGFVRSLDFTVEAQIASGLLQPVLRGLERRRMVAGVRRLSAASTADCEDPRVHRFRRGPVPAGRCSIPPLRSHRPDTRDRVARSAAAHARAVHVALTATKYIATCGMIVITLTRFLIRPS